MSKNTIYFDSIQEAKQYFTDGVPSNVIAIVGDGSQVLVSSDNATNGNQEYYSVDTTNDEIVNQMVQDSYTEGEAAGYKDGYSEGVDDGYDEGYSDGTLVVKDRDYYSGMPLTFTNCESLSLWLNNKVYCKPGVKCVKSMSYRIDYGDWVDIDFDKPSAEFDYITEKSIYNIIVPQTQGETHTVQLAGEINTNAYFSVDENGIIDSSSHHYDYESYDPSECDPSNDLYTCVYIDVTCDSVEGSVESIYNKDGDGVTNLELPWLFCGSNVHDASNLYLPDVTYKFQYAGMFADCQTLTKAPDLPSTNLTFECYAHMFERCFSLVNAFKLPANESNLVAGCYRNMFSDCNMLEDIVLDLDYNEYVEKQKTRSASIINNFACYQMFGNISCDNRKHFAPFRINWITNIYDNIFTEFATGDIDIICTLFNVYSESIENPSFDEYPYPVTNMTIVTNNVPNDDYTQEYDLNCVDIDDIDKRLGYKYLELSWDGQKEAYNNYLAWQSGYSEGEQSGGGSGTPTPEELDQQAFLFFTQGPGFEHTNEVMNYVSDCGTQSCNIDTLDVEQYKDYLANTSSFENLDFPYNIYITLYDPTQTPEFQWGTFSGYLTPSYNVSANGDVTVTFTPSNDCKVGFGLLPLKFDRETGDIVPNQDMPTISSFLKFFDNGETDEWDNAIYRHLTNVEAGKTYTARFYTTTDPESGGDNVAFTFEEVVQP